ncbi:MAG: adenylate/guanylate cyclase domain-containing protein [Chloroflexota bacterium]
MWSYVLILAVGLLGLIALALVVWSRLHAQRPMGLAPVGPLTLVPPAFRFGQSVERNHTPWWRHILPRYQQRLARDVDFLYQTIGIVSRANPLEHMLHQVTQALTGHLGAEMGRVFLLDEEETLQLAVSVGATHTPLPHWEFTLPNLALAADKPLVIADLSRWPQLRAFISTSDVSSALWLPLKSGSQAVGALGLGSRRRNAFHRDTVSMVAAVAAYLAASVETQRLAYKVKQEQALRRTLERYVSPRLVHSFQKSPAMEQPEIIDGSERITVLFADVRDYTPLMERCSTDAVMLVLNEYFLRMSQIIQAHGGVVDEFAGDEIVASFDRSSPRVNDAYRAVRASIEMLESLKSLGRRWHQRGLPVFDIGIGISTGLVRRGSVGSAERRALIALGSILNIASRAEAMNKKFGTHLIITQSTFEQVSHLIEYDALGAHHLQGISEPISLYSVWAVKNHHLAEPKETYDPNGFTQATQRGQTLAQRASPDAGPTHLT